MACRLPRRIRFDGTTAPDELTEHRVIHPRSGEKPCPDAATLPGIRAQRPGPHMGGRALRALTGPRLTRHRLIRHRDRCRIAAVAVTPLHTHTVKPTPDNPDPPGATDTACRCCTHIWFCGRCRISLSPAQAHCCRSSSSTSMDKYVHLERRATPGDARDGAYPGLDVRGLRPKIRVRPRTRKV